jgi:hypothetical protein
LHNPADESVNLVPLGTWLISPGERVTLTNPQAAARLTEEDRLMLLERGITLHGDIFVVPDVWFPLEQTFYPPIPEPQHKDDFPPETSTELLVAANPVDQLFVQSSNGTIFPTSGEVQGLPVRLDPPFPATAKLAYRRYWQNMFNTRISGGLNFTRAIETQEGMSETDTISLSAKLGFGPGVPFEQLKVKLSAELSATTTHAVTITENRKVTETYSFSVEEGKVAMYTLWQLIEVFALVDDNDNPIDWSGDVVLNLPLVGDMEIDAKFPPDRHTNHADRYAASLHTFDA